MSLTKVSYSLISGAPFNVLDFGAVGDGITDDTIALQNAINAAAGSILNIPAGTYLISSTLTLSTSYTSITGDGSNCTKIIGNFASGDILYVGNSSRETTHVQIKGLTIDSNVQKTSGAAFHFCRCVRSHYYDLEAAGSDSAEQHKYLWDGFWFDGFAVVIFDTFQSCVQNTGLILNSNTTLAGDFFVTNGGIQYCTLGMLVGGGVGGLATSHIDIIDNVNSLIIDQSISGIPNNDAWFGPSTYFDTTSQSSIIIDNGLTHQISFQGTSIASVAAGHGIWIKSLIGYLILDGLLIGSISEDGVRVDDPDCHVNLSSSSFINCGGYGYNQNVIPSSYTNLQLTALEFSNNTLGTTNGVSTYISNPQTNNYIATAEGSSSSISYSLQAKGSGSTIQLRTGGGLQAAAVDVANSNRWITLKGSNSGNPKLGVSAGAVEVEGPLILSLYTLATLPSASSYAKGIAYVSDGASNKHLVVSDGVHWYYQDGTIAV